MKRSSMDFDVFPYLGQWDLGGSLVITKRDDEFHTKRAYRGGSGYDPSRPPAMKDEFFLSVISSLAEEPAYVIRLADPEPLADQMRSITEACGLPLVFESFP